MSVIGQILSCPSPQSTDMPDSNLTFEIYPQVNCTIPLFAEREREREREFVWVIVRKNSSIYGLISNRFLKGEARVISGTKCNLAPRHVLETIWTRKSILDVGLIKFENRYDYALIKAYWRLRLRLGDVYILYLPFYSSDSAALGGHERGFHGGGGGGREQQQQQQQQQQQPSCEPIRIVVDHVDRKRGRRNIDWLIPYLIVFSKVTCTELHKYLELG